MENPLAPADATPRVVITGASQGIGKAILLDLARGGQPVLGLSRSKPAEFIEGATGSLAWQHLDLSKGTDVEQCAASLGIPVRALVLSAVDYGASSRHATADTSAKEWLQVVGTTCIGQSILVSGLLPKLVKNAPGVVINISSDVAITPAAGRAAYGASKAGLHATLRAVAAEHSLEQLRVYQLIPTFQTLTEGIRSRRPAGFDFSGYADASLFAQLVQRLLSPSNSTAPGSYLIRRDGSLDPYAETASV